LLIALAVQAFLAACVAALLSPSKPEPSPGPLPGNVRPLHYTLALRVDPDQPRFSGTAEIAIELDRPREQLWMHGRGLHVIEASADGSPARFEQVTDDGVARLSLPRRAITLSVQLLQRETREAA
jgi:alanyl aminopeptidase